MGDKRVALSGKFRRVLFVSAPVFILTLLFSVMAETDGFRKAADTTHLFYEMDGHYNPKGHQVFADLLAPLLTT